MGNICRFGKFALRKPLIYAKFTKASPHVETCHMLFSLMISIESYRI